MQCHIGVWYHNYFYEYEYMSVPECISVCFGLFVCLCVHVCLYINNELLIQYLGSSAVANLDSSIEINK